MRHPEPTPVVDCSLVPQDQVHSRSGIRGRLLCRYRRGHATDRASVSRRRTRDDFGARRPRLGQGNASGSDQGPRRVSCSLVASRRKPIRVLTTTCQVRRHLGICDCSAGYLEGSRTRCRLGRLGLREEDEERAQPRDTPTIVDLIPSSWMFSLLFFV